MDEANRNAVDCELPEMRLGELVEMLREVGMSARVEGDESLEVRTASIDSRSVLPGGLFICKGVSFKPSFLRFAIDRGAAAYMCQGEGAGLAVPHDLAECGDGISCLVVDDVRKAMAIVSAGLFDHPDNALTVTGITGTKGKSTVAYMLRSILLADGIEPSILGSIMTDDGIVSYESHNTTPEAPDLWRHLRNTVESGRRHMVMEVSSHALKYDRVLGLHFDIGCFLNIGRDHISSVEHADFEDYFSSKLRLFEQCDVAVVNLRTDHVGRVLEAAGAAKRLVTFRVDDSNAGERREANDAVAEAPIADYAAGRVESTTRGLAFDVREPGVDGAEHIELGMPGLFNVDNALAAIAMARLLGVGYDAIRKGLAELRVPGRMELVPSPDGHVLAIVDYAHNELSYHALFSSVKEEYPDRRIVALFGAPGGKAYERREALPRVAGAYADHIVYTEEDPAHDRVEDICAELVSHTPAGVSCEVILDREDAVRRVLESALGDERPSVVLLLAKGDETRQHRGDEYPEVKSDLAIARETLRA